MADAADDTDEYTPSAEEEAESQAAMMAAARKELAGVTYDTVHRKETRLRIVRAFAAARAAEDAYCERIRQGRGLKEVNLYSDESLVVASALYAEVSRIDEITEEEVQPYSNMGAVLLAYAGAVMVVEAYRKLSAVIDEATVIYCDGAAEVGERIAAAYTDGER